MGRYGAGVMRSVHEPVLLSGQLRQCEVALVLTVRTRKKYCFAQVQEYKVASELQCFTQNATLLSIDTQFDSPSVFPCEVKKGSLAFS